jgi:tripartite ATP-independent transporter DctM subunit
MTVSIAGFACLLLLIFLRVPIAFAMGFVGFFGFLYLNDYNVVAAMSMSARRVINTSQDYGLSVIPLFILMGNLVTRAGLSQELYKASYSFLGHLRGGLSMATVVACGGFSAICGSSLATAATMAKVSMPSMRKYGYSDSLAAASIAAGGTLGILIPPSVILVIYGIMSEQSIRELFAAGFLPGLLGVGLYLCAVSWTVWRKPESGPRGERVSGRERLQSLKGVWGILLLFGIVMGGIYGGVFTPTEAAGIGAAGAFVIALARR